MSKGFTVGLVIVGGAALVGGIAWAITQPSGTVGPALPGAPPPPPPSLNQTLYEVGSTATKVGLSVYEKATGSAPTKKDVALTLATGGAYIPVKTAVNWVGKIF